MSAAARELDAGSSHEGRLERVERVAGGLMLHIDGEPLFVSGEEFPVAPEQLMVGVYLYVKRVAWIRGRAYRVAQ